MPFASSGENNLVLSGRTEFFFARDKYERPIGGQTRCKRTERIIRGNRDCAPAERGSRCGCRKKPQSRGIPSAIGDAAGEADKNRDKNKGQNSPHPSRGHSCCRSRRKLRIVAASNRVLFVA